jgi:hypothetical protein
LKGNPRRAIDIQEGVAGMDEVLQHAVVTAFTALPEGCRHNAATEEQLRGFEEELGQVPRDMRWFLKACGGGVVGSEWVDDIVRLIATHRKFHLECGQGGWTMRNVFVIGWDGAGNPFGIELTTGQVLVEDHNFGGVHEMARSFQSFLTHGFDLAS